MFIIIAILIVLAIHIALLHADRKLAAENKKARKKAKKQAKKSRK